MGLQIFGNLDRNTLASGLVISGTNLNQKVAPNFVAGDNISVDIFLTSNSGFQDIQDFTTQKLAIGPINAKPTGGTYKIDYGGTSNQTLNFDASAQDFADAINANAPSVPTPVTGTEIAPSTYIIDFGSNGTCSLPTIDSSGLTPSSAVHVQRLITGDSSTKEKWLVRIFQNPIAFISSGFTDITDSSGNKGIRGSLNLATEGVYDLLDSNASATSTFELEITDSSGSVQTIFQTPITILADVIGVGSSASSELPSSIPASAITFLNSFPNPTFVGNVTFSGSTGLNLTGGGNVDISAGGELIVGSFVVDSSTGNITSDVTIEGDITGEVGFDGEVTFQDSVTFQGDIAGIDTSDVSGLSSALALKANLANPTFTTDVNVEGNVIANGIKSSSESDEIINYDAKQHNFRDFDGNPGDLLVIRKIDGYTGGRIGINQVSSSSVAAALHITAGKNASTNVSDDALRVIGGSFFNDWVRIGHYDDAARDNIGRPNNGTIIYNSEFHEFQVYIGGGTGWRAISTQAVSTPS